MLGLYEREQQGFGLGLGCGWIGQQGPWNCDIKFLMQADVCLLVHSLRYNAGTRVFFGGSTKSFQIISLFLEFKA